MINRNIYKVKVIILIKLLEIFCALSKNQNIKSFLQ